MGKDTGVSVGVVGATGYTGRLIARACLARGLPLVLFGRDGGRLGALAAQLGGVPHRVSRGLDARSLTGELAGLSAVINAAGPFAATASPVVEACLAAGVHYLDIGGEIDALLAVRARDAQARARGVMLLPAAGFEVAASDCLAVYVARRLPALRELHVGIAGLSLVSRGSARTLMRELTLPLRVRRAGHVRPAGPTESVPEQRFDFGRGPSAAVPVSWADVVTAYHSTGAREVTTYFEATPPVRAAVLGNRSLAPFVQLTEASPLFAPLRAFRELNQHLLSGAAAWLPPGPDEATRARASATVVIEGRAGRGGEERFVARLRTPEAYTFTAEMAARLAARVQAGDHQPGFQTPGRLYGADLALEVPGVYREDLSGPARPQTDVPARANTSQGI